MSYLSNFKQRKWYIPAAGIVLLPIAVGAFMVTAQRNNDAVVVKPVSRHAKEVFPAREQQVLDATTDNTSTTEQPSVPTPPAPATVQPKKTSVPKPAPTSAPQPNNFTTKITRPYQVAPGTMTLSANSWREYYAGDLKVEPSTIYFNNGSSRQITVSTPDGKIVGPPKEEYEDQSPYFIVAMSSSVPNNSSFSMFITQKTPTLPPPGTYTIHITTGYGTNNNNDLWHYHGWLYVVVQ